MIKTNLPVIILKGLVLLPNNEVRIEFADDVTRNIIDVAELFHDNNILVISQIDPLEEDPDIKDLPKVGVIAKIDHKLELPNGLIRVIIRGVKRALVHEYMDLNRTSEVLESIVSEDLEEKTNKKEEEIIVGKIKRELQSFVKEVPYVSNSILSITKNVQKIGKLTDLIAPILDVDLARLQKYLEEMNAKVRASMVLEDIYKNKEMLKVERKIDGKVKKTLDKSQKDFILRERIKAIKEELGEINSKDDEVTNLYKKLEELDAPIKIKDKIKEEIKKYEMIPSMSPELGIIRSYIDWMINLPWNNFTVDNDNLADVRTKLNNSHYGLDKVKTRIIEYLAVKQMTNSLKSPIICLVGPPGVGKTSLAISIAKAIDRNFVKMSVGGVSDESEIMGHRRTYMGAMPGRIIQSMKKAESTNPLFLIDEIDKMTKDIKGDPASALLSVLDPEQNMHFSDNYIEEEFDLSKVMFVATANSLEDIPFPLRDRLEIIELSGYTEYEKLDIAQKHLIPKICINHGIDNNLIIFDNKAILEIIRSYTREAGVRELERQLANVIRKIITTHIEHDVVLKKTVITKEDLEIYLGKNKYNLNKNYNNVIGVVNGLAYTNYGGDVLPIEVNYYPGEGKLVLTGNLGNIMKESATIALSYIKANHKEFGIDYDILCKNDIHIHVPDGAIPKDGPSAGIALTTALISAFKNVKVNPNLALTGEITLRGNVLAIGGLKEKSIGAHRNGIRRIIIPKSNRNDLEDIPKEIKKDIDYIMVNNYKEVFKYLIGGINNGR